MINHLRCSVCGKIASYEEVYKYRSRFVWAKSKWKCEEHINDN